MRDQSVWNYLTVAEVSFVLPAPCLHLPFTPAHYTHTNTRTPTGPPMFSRMCSRTDRLWNVTTGSTHNFFPSSEQLDLWPGLRETVILCSL